MNNPLLVEGALIGTHDQMNQLPVGTVICETHNEARRWEKREDQRWYGVEAMTGAGPHRPHDFSMGQFNKVLSIPTDPWVPPPPDTLRQFQWKFRENAISGAHENGVSLDACLKGLRLLGLDDDMFPMGPGVKFKVLDDRVSWPENTVIANATHTNPKADRFTLYVRRHRGWHTFLGRMGLGRDAVVLEYPGVESPPEWWAEVGNDESEQEVLQFKARAWRISRQIKDEQSWCGTLEHVIARVGVTARSVREAYPGGSGVGDRVGQRDAGRCPEGTLFLYRSTEWTDHWAVYLRDNSQDNLCRTRRIAGHRNENAPALGNYQSSMVVLCTPIRGYQSEYVVDQGCVAQMIDLLPVGTVFTYSGVRYVIAQDRRITQYPQMDGVIPNRGMHQPYVFNGAPITINRFPEEQS